MEDAAKWHSIIGLVTKLDNNFNQKFSVAQYFYEGLAFVVCNSNQTFYFKRQTKQILFISNYRIFGPSQNWEPTILLLPLLAAHCNTKPPVANTYTQALLPPQSIQILFPYTLLASPYFLKCSLKIFSHPLWRQAAFRLVLDGRSFGNLSFFLHRKSPRRLSPSLIIALDSGTE